MDVEQRDFDGQAVGSAGDSDGDMEMDVDINDLCAGINEMDIDDVDTEMSDSCPSTPSTTYSAVWASSPQAPPSTPQTTFSRAFSTPKSSGSSFSQMVAETPTPANNAFAPMPEFSGDMDGVVSTRPRNSIYKSRHAASGAPPKNGTIPFTMEAANPQQAAAQQPTHQQFPAQQPAIQQGPAAEPATQQPANPAQQPATQQSTHQPSPTLPPLPPLPAAWLARRHTLKPFEPLEQITHGLASFHISDPATHNWTGAATFAPYIGKAAGSAFEAKIATPGMDALISSFASFHTTEAAGEAAGPTGPAPAPAPAQSYARMPRSKPFMFELAHWPVVFYLSRRMTGPLFHVTKEKDQNWMGPTVFGPFVGKAESEGFEARFRAVAAAFAAGRVTTVEYVDKGKGVAAESGSADQGEAVAAEPQTISKRKGVAVPGESYEVGSDEDPNVDLDFDFAKVFRPRAPASDKGKGVAAGLQLRSSDKGKGVAVGPQSTDKSKATPRAKCVLYHYGYANGMMDQMYYYTLPRLAVEFDSRDKPWYTEDRREDDMFDLKANMDRNELNDTSFNTVDEAYLERPILDRVQLFDLFDDWWTEDMNDHLSRIFRDWDEDALVEFGNILRSAFYAYMDNHPPAAEEDSQ